MYEFVGSHVTQVSEELELVFQEQVSLAGVAQGELGELCPGAALGGGHVHNILLLADLLSKVSVVHTVLSAESNNWKSLEVISYTFWVQVRNLSFYLS